MEKIALDVMGGDHAPLEIVRGALKAVEKGFVAADAVVLCGDETKIREILRAEKTDENRFSIFHAPEVIEMHESPVEALRKKRNASVVGCVGLVSQKKAGAIVSMGHTGAAVAAATLGLKMLEGVRRPGIAVTFPGEKGPVTVIDVGANINCKAIHLFHYGLMASCYAHDTLGIAEPRIGLLSIGEEEGKGTELVRETHELFRNSNLKFLGNVEGQDIFRGTADVVVCEGFVGNVVLKVSEGLADFIFRTLKGALASGASSSGASPSFPPVMQEAIKKFQSKVDYTEYGGAMLLGVDGIMIIGHGRSDARAVASAIRVAAQFIKADVNKHILAGLQKLAPAANSGGKIS